MLGFRRVSARCVHGRYNASVALLKDLNADPMDQFRGWFAAAEKKMGHEWATAFCLSTLDLGGFPDGRMILLKEFDAQGFVFYTNLHSAKGRAIAGRARAAMTFYWQPLDRQVRIQGNTELVSDAEADAYFHGRARLSQLGAWASQQSQPLPSRFTLMREVVRFARKYPAGAIPRPPQWTGIRIKPLKIEFWQAGANRLHDRFLYEKQSGGAWAITRLYP
jgi:pyridoxamine 5'-phosphate oxidase